MEQKKVVVLGCTGSIGKSTLEVIGALKPRFDVVALACRTSVDLLLRQAREFSPTAAAVAGPLGPGAEARLREAGLEGIYQGEQGLLRMLSEVPADVVVNGISGARGLLPSIKTLEAGMTLALANKETIVMAGGLVSELGRRNGAMILPVDSEHHALFTLLRHRRKEEVRRIFLTASGGAFRNLSYEELRHVRVEDALAHPNWRMGAKITVDSATMANKGLEVIEAYHLFDIALESIEVLIHPQSYVHSLIQTTDGFLYAQLSQPDMRLPIQNALTHPDLVPSGMEPFDLTGKTLSFEPADPRKYRLLPLAYEAAAQSGAYPVAYNAANEVAVDRFLERGIPFLEIPGLVEETLQEDWSRPVRSIEEILQADREARGKTTEILRKRRIA